MREAFMQTIFTATTAQESSNIRSITTVSYTHLEQLKDLDLLDLVAATGMKQKECTVKELKEALKKKDVIYTGDYTDLEYKKLVTSKVDLAILTGEVLPQKEDKEVSSDSDSKKKLTEKEQRELLKDMTERLSLIHI